MKPVYVNSRIYIDSNKENIKKNSKLEVRGHVRISKCEKHFCKMLHSKLV